MQTRHEPALEKEAVERLAEVRGRIEAACHRSGRSVTDVTLIAATKTVSAERLLPFVKAGLACCGENYVQEGLGKIAELQELAVAASVSAPTWHLIGALQSNKAKNVVGAFGAIHSVDRLSLAQAIDKAAAILNTVQPVLVQVNIGDESSKAGCAVEGLAGLVQECRALSHLRVTGLMCLPPYNPNPEATRPYFESMRLARESLMERGLAAGDWALSMGMSNDFEVAIEEGATLVRVGTALFGAPSWRLGAGASWLKLNLALSTNSLVEPDEFYHARDLSAT